MATPYWSELFSPHQLGELTLPNRFVCAPMTRSRASQPGDVPTELNAEYYAQRASAGLIITEATQISREGKGYGRTPGIYTNRQRDGWKLVTQAVHEAGGRIFLQLWHVGRVSHPIFHEGHLPVAPSAIQPRRVRVYTFSPETGELQFIDCVAPRSLKFSEIPRVIEDYRRAASLTMEAGFDGVEIHGANGYLIDQFLRSTTNLRKDAYGGSPENRLRFLCEVVQAVGSEVGMERTGLRLSPHVKLQDMDDPEIIETSLLAADILQKYGIAYLHLAEADWDDAPVIPDDFRVALRKRFTRTIIAAGRYTPQKGVPLIQAGLVDMITFGRPFLANPDLPKRIAEGLELNAPDPDTFFGGGAKGYTDYPTYAEAGK